MHDLLLLKAQKIPTKRQMFYLFSHRLESFVASRILSIKSYDSSPSIVLIGCDCHVRGGLEKEDVAVGVRHPNDV